MNLGILLWNTCNAACSHCAVNSGPKEAAEMTNEQIFRLIDSSFSDGERPSIGLSGGEAFLFFDRLCEIISYATNKGARIAINTNGFWGNTLEKAVEKVKVLKKLGVSQITVSMDDFHQEYVAENRVLNVVRACKVVHLEVRLQFVATRRSRRLADLLAKYGDVFLNIECREIPCHPVGRAGETVLPEDLFTQEEIPPGLCPSAILSISAKGKVIPCCNTAGHLPSLEIGTVDQDLSDLNRKFLDDPLFSVLRLKGPASLYEAAQHAGYEPRPDGYIDQCHLCYDLFKDEGVAQAARRAAEGMAEQIRFEHLLEDYQRFLPTTPMLSAKLVQIESAIAMSGVADL